MKNILIILIMALQTLPAMAYQSIRESDMPKPFKIVPTPKSITLLSDKGLSFGTLKNLQMVGRFNRPIMGDILSSLTELNTEGQGVLTLKLDTSEVIPKSLESYILTIANGNVEIVASGNAGLFYGCQTLEQLLEDARDFNTPIPACKIIDSPSLSYRAVHFDVKHHLDHMNVYYESIDRLARYKINAIVFEFEDKLRYRRQPLIGAPSAISIDEMAALTEYAKERHIEITPLVQGLGHATFILKHEEYAPLRELPDNRWAFCPLDEGTYEVLFDLYRDAFEATPGSRYIHIGGDEIGNIGLCHRCKPTADKEGLLSLNLYWLKRVSEFARVNGRIPIFWDDMPLKEANVYESTYTKEIDFEQATKDWKVGGPILEDLISKFPKDCVYMRWNYSMANYPGNLMALDWYQEHGLKSMISNAANSGPAALFPFDERDNGMDSRGLAAIRNFVQIAAEKGIDGMLCTAWDDRSPHIETYWRGLIAAAEYSWSPNNRTLQEYDLAYLQREYGTTRPNYQGLYKKLREAAFFWEKAFNETGSRMDMENALFVLPGLAHWQPAKNHTATEKIDFNKLLIELPDVKNLGDWSKKYKKRLDEAQMILDKYPLTSKALDSLSSGSKRNRYHWKLFKVLNDFQIVAPKLMIALKQSDSKKTSERAKGAKNIRAVLKEFNSAWKNLQAVYAETRFTSYPSNYVPDRYYHFASQREDLTWMVQVEELLHTMINEWLDDNGMK